MKISLCYRYRVVTQQQCTLTRRGVTVVQTNPRHSKVAVVSQ